MQQLKNDKYSHQVIMNPWQVRDTVKLALINYLTDQAISTAKEVVLWDHALCGLDYYPTKFKIGSGDTVEV